MTRVKREQIVDYVTWSKRRPDELPAILAAKRRRRVHVGDTLTFLFENSDTIRYQIQEMMRVEKMVEEAAIVHEIDTYNEVLGDEGGFGCALLIEIDDPEERKTRLAELLGLPERLYLRFEDGSKVRPSFDERQVGQHQLSSVQYLKFDAQGRVPVAVGADHPALSVEQELTAEQREALAADLEA
jgi:hypothetical protein